MILVFNIHFQKIKYFHIKVGVEMLYWKICVFKRIVFKCLYESKLKLNNLITRIKCWNLQFAYKKYYFPFNFRYKIMSCLFLLFIVFSLHTNETFFTAIKNHQVHATKTVVPLHSTLKKLCLLRWKQVKSNIKCYSQKLSTENLHELELRIYIQN